MSELDACIGKGLIRKIPPSKERAIKSIGKAERWLNEAKKALGYELFDSCLVSSYAAMFHAARALLFKDGFREKSHYCVARYVEEKYASTGKISQDFVDILDRLRNLRHEDLYELDFSATQEEARGAVENAEIFVAKIKSIL